jgi:hypothetical protein
MVPDDKQLAGAAPILSVVLRSVNLSTILAKGSSLTNGDSPLRGVRLPRCQLRTRTYQLGSLTPGLFTASPTAASRPSTSAKKS